MFGFLIIRKKILLSGSEKFENYSGGGGAIQFGVNPRGL